MAMSKKHYSLFSVFGIELEYMIVDMKDLSIRPMADQLILKVAGHLDNEVELGPIAISNELALHVIELKTNGPVKTLEGLAECFYEVILQLNEILKGEGAQLMPTGAHPWLDPKKGIQLWHHGDRKIYETFHRIFNCSGHGWGNLQSTHLNLPFGNEEEFVRLHTAIRLLLPFIPALTASTPILEGVYEGALDARLLFYGSNQAKIPHISGFIVPEAIDSIEAYHRLILNPMYEEIAQYDHENLMQNEWLNSRGAIARFERNAIEIRILDLQESPMMDISIIGLLTKALKYLTEKNLLASLTYPTEALKKIYDEVIHLGFEAVIQDPILLSFFSLPLKAPCSVKMFWQALFESIPEKLTQEEQEAIHRLLKEGNLAQRILTAVGTPIEPKNLKTAYENLCESLKQNKAFIP